MTKYSKQEIENSNRIQKSATPKYTLDWYVKWVASVFVLAGMSMRGVEGLQLYDLIASTVGITLWLVVSILWKDRAAAPQAAEALKITAKDLHELGLVDEVVPEPFGGAHNDHDAMADTLRDALLHNLEALEQIDPEIRLQERYAKYRSHGKYIEG